MTRKRLQFHLVLFALAIGCVFVFGCNRQQGSPPKTTTDRLISLSIDELKAELGEPDSEIQISGRPDFGPYPESLAENAPCTCLNYADHQGQQLHVYCVSPEVFQKATGRHPGDNELYVLEVFAYPKGTVF